MKKRIKIAITGAAGQISYSLLFRLASGQTFPNIDLDIRLLEIPEAMGALEGVVMELEDCAFPAVKSIIATNDPKVAFDGIDWALLIGSAPRKKGMERKDLLQINGNIFKAQGEALNTVAGPDVQVLVVGNPCNTNALIAMNHAKDIPNRRFFAMTALDEKRAIGQLAKKAGVPVEAITNMAIFGNHSATQFPDFYHTLIQNRPALESIPETWLQEHFLTTIQQRGAAIIQARGASSAASAANAALSTVVSLTQPQSTCFSVALCSQGEYRITPGLIFSYPCQLHSSGKLQILEGWEHSPAAQQLMDNTHQELLDEWNTVKALGLV